MATKQHPAEAAPPTSRSEGHKHGETTDQERRVREFVGFFGSLASLILIGLGILPESTVAEKFLVNFAAVALSCAFTLAIKLVPWSRPAAWLAISSALGVVSLAALSILAYQDAHSTSDIAATSGTSSTITQGTHSVSNPVINTPSGRQATTNPSSTSAPPSRQPLYTLPFSLPGSDCQSGADVSNVVFTQQTPKVTVTAAGGGDIDFSCAFGQTTLQFSGQPAPVVGDPGSAQCAAEVATNPISLNVPFDQIRPGNEYCFIAGSGSAPRLLVLATVETVSGPPTFTTTWTATVWNMPSTS